MNKLYIDQYGNKLYAESVKALRAQVEGGGSRVAKMYRNGVDGNTYHVGYVVGQRWFSAYTPMRKLA